MVFPSIKKRNKVDYKTKVFNQKKSNQTRNRCGLYDTNMKVVDSIYSFISPVMNTPALPSETCDTERPSKASAHSQVHDAICSFKFRDRETEKHEDE